MITIKKNKTPDLPLCKMLCDNGLHTKLDEFELTSYMNCHSTNLFIGRPRSGKTSLLYSFFKSKQLFRKVYDKIFLFQPVQSSNSMKDNIFSTLPETQRFPELNLENLESVLEIIESQEDKKSNFCIIFDDMSASLKDLEIKKKMRQIIFNRRHLHISVFFLVQTYKSIDKDIRKLFSNVFIFKVTKNECEDMFEELVNITHKKNIPLICNEVFDKQYNFLFINIESQKMYKNFDELILSS